jgi:hypothetical protein
LPRAAEVVVGEPCCHASGDRLEPLVAHAVDDIGGATDRFEATIVSTSPQIERLEERLQTGAGCLTHQESVVGNHCSATKPHSRPHDGGCMFPLQEIPNWPLRRRAFFYGGDSRRLGGGVVWVCS